MKGQYDDFDDNDLIEHIGLGASRKKMTKNEQIYGDFYQPYEKQATVKTRPMSYGKSAYNYFKAGEKIQNYAKQCEIVIPEARPKKKVKKDQFQGQQEEYQQPQIGHFNLQSFLRDYQQKQQLQKIDEQQEQESYNGPFCLNQKVKSKLKLVKIGEDDDEMSDIQGMDGELNINEMTFEQYRKLVMNRGNKQPQYQKKKRLTPEQRQKQQQFIQGYGVGYKMLQKMGFNISKGLGKEQKGIQRPVEAVFKKAFTTKDSQLKQQQQKDQQSQGSEQQVSPQVNLFQLRSRNLRINNFLLDLKNKFQSLNSKIYFYERQVQNFDRDFQINNSLKLQKQNQIQSHEDQIKKLRTILQYGRLYHRSGNQSRKSHKQQLNLRNIYPHLALQYKMDILYVKNQYLTLKQLKDAQLYEQFPQIITRMNAYLSNFYLEKQRQTIKGYQEGLRNFKDRNNKVINLEEEVIDLIQQGPTQQESMASVSFQDQQKIIKMIQLIAQNTLLYKVSQTFARYRHIGDIKNFKILECLRVLRSLNKNSEIVKKVVNLGIKPLLFKYYQHFQLQQMQKVNKQQKKLISKKAKQQILPHFVIFPLFQIMDPKQLQLGRFLKKLSQKLWSLKSLTLYKILKPILQYCPSSERNNFINFYLAPRLLYHLEGFDLTQPQVCKQLMTNFKLYKQFLSEDILKDLLNCTLIPQLVMTYKKYQQEGMRNQDLNQWLKRWDKQIGKIHPHYFQETLSNDFHISF